MPTKIFAFVVLLALALTARCADEKLSTLKVGSQIYTNVTVTTVTTTDIHFFHAHGIGNAKLKDLEPDMQQHFHFNADAAQTAEQQRAAGNAEYLRKIEAKNPAPPAPAVAANPAPAPSRGPEEVPAHDIHAKSFLNQRAPNFVVEKWLTAQPDTSGKFILIDFWATWCGPCKQAIPHLNGLYAKYKDQVVFVGLSDETEEDVRKLTTPQMEYSVAIDTTHRMKDEIQIRGIPHALLIDPHGYVRFEGHPLYLNENNFGQLLARFSK